MNTSRKEEERFFERAVNLAGMPTALNHNETPPRHKFHAQVIGFASNFLFHVLSRRSTIPPDKRIQIYSLTFLSVTISIYRIIYIYSNITNIILRTILERRNRNYSFRPNPDYSLKQSQLTCYHNP